MFFKLNVNTIFKMYIQIINGPNLGILGRRETDIYGNISFEEFYKDLQKQYKNITIYYYQNNSEGFIIDKLYKINPSCNGIIINAGALTHTSIALSDAIKAINIPVIEVHISNIYKRELYRHKSYIAPNCIGSIIGFGLYSYKMGIDWLINNCSSVN